MPSPPGMEWGVSQTEEKEWGIGDTGLEVVGEAGIVAAGLGAWIAWRAEGMVRRGASGWGTPLLCGHRDVVERSTGITVSRGWVDSFPRTGMAGGGGQTPFLAREWRARAGEAPPH
jgi:hypothetical protein